MSEASESGEDEKTPKKEGKGDDVEFNEEEAKSAKEVLQSLAKTAKTLKIYLPNNPVHKKFIEQLVTRLQAHLLSFGPLRLRVKQFELYCSEQVVYENINRLESIAFKLFIDGMREISFLPGIEQDEVLYFLQALGREGDDIEADDDIVTILWEKNLSHIQYVVVESLQNDAQEMDSCKEMQATRPSQQKLESVFKQEGSLSLGKLSPKVQRKIEIHSLHLFKLTEEEIVKLKLEMQREEDLNVVGELIGILFDILRIERQVPIFSEILDILDNIFNRLMSRGDLSHAKKVLEFFWEMLDPSKKLPEPIETLVRNALKNAGNSKKMVLLEPFLNTARPDFNKELFSFMILFERNVIPPTIDLLASVKNMKTRRILCDALVELGRMDVGSIISRLKDERWFLVRNLIYVLGKIGDNQIIQAFSRFRKHVEPKVRKEVLHALDAMEDEKARQLMTQFIVDPDQANRIFVIKSLARKGVKEGLAPLKEVISSKAFDSKDFYEKKEYFNAVAMIGGDESVPEMQKHLYFRWTLFRDARKEEKGLCAARALKRIASPLAIEVLQKGGTSRNKAIREACAKALSSLEVKQI
ncbi:MAG: HEAT repeat domain-containing protein [Nitrospira sp.]